MLTLAAIVLLGSCEKNEAAPEPGQLQIKFDNMLGNEDFQLQKNYLINGSNYKFENFRYWISNIRLQKEDGSWYSISNSYYLIEETGSIDIQERQFKYAA